MLKLLKQLTLLMLLSTLRAELGCVCEMNDKDFSSKGGSPLQNTVKVSRRNHKVDGVDIGKIFSVNGVIYTQKNYQVKMSTKTLALEDGAQCPKHFRRMSLEDLQNIADFSQAKGVADVLDENKMNFSPGEEFYSTVREHPDGTGFDAYKFKAIKVKEDDSEVTVGVKSTTMRGTIKKTKCVMVSELTNEGAHLDTDLQVGKVNVLKLKMTNVIDFQVDFGQGQAVTGKSKVKFVVSEPGCVTVKKKWKMFDNSIVTQCDARLARQVVGSNSKSGFRPKHIKNQSYEGVTANSIKGLHFAPATAPMAAMNDGQAYILYQNSESKALSVLLVNNELEEQKRLDLGVDGVPLAIAADTFGFVVYARGAEDSHHSWVSLYSHDGDLQWSQTIMNNGNNATKAEDQLDFFKSEGKRLFGMSAMFNPHNGKLLIGRGRIFLVFAHYNNFKAESGGVDNHTGDTMVSCDFDGKDWKLGSSWSTSHSLDQNAVYNGKRFITSSLGDAFPQQIKFTWNDGKYSNNTVDPVLDIRNRFNHKGTSDLISGEIPGNGTGKSCGRLGGLSQITFRRKPALAQVYSRHSCTSGLSGSPKTNTVDEIGVVVFDSDLNKIKEKSLGDGSRVSHLVSAKYGRDIFVMFNRVSEEKAEGTFLPTKIDRENDQVFGMVLRSGSLRTTRAHQLKENIIPTDLPVTLSNGNVAWTVVDANGALTAYRLKAPKALKIKVKAGVTTVASSEPVQVELRRLKKVEVELA